MLIFFQKLTVTSGNATRYHHFNALAHALSYIFSQFNMVWGYLQCVTIKFIEKHILTFFQKLTVTSDNATHYHYFNALSHALSYIFFRFSMFQGYLEWLTIIIFFRKLTVTCGNATQHHHFNALSHALSYIFCQFSMVWGYLQRVTMCYDKFIKKTYVNISLKILTLTHDKKLKIALNQVNLKENIK